jgi:septum formation protein
MATMHENTKIILASESPRRRRLLEQAQIDFRVISSRIDESAVCALTPEIHALTLAEAKAAAVSKKYPDAWVIGADSIVVIDDLILNKPAGAADAEQMLARLNGRTHRVITGYSIRCRVQHHCHSNVCITRVTFRNLSEAEIRWYLNTPEPWDKAGAYAIQGVAASMVQSIQGSYTNVVGLPVSEVVDHLLEHGAILRTPGQDLSGGLADASEIR